MQSNWKAVLFDRAAEGRGEVRVSGMPAALAQNYRRWCTSGVAPAATEEFSPEQVIDAIRAALPEPLSVGLVLGSAMREWAALGMDEELPDVVVVLITDPQDIDSKWMTYVSPLEGREAVFRALYKFDPCAVNRALSATAEEGGGGD